MDRDAQDTIQEFSPERDALKISDEEIVRLLSLFEDNLNKGQLTIHALRTIVSAFEHSPQDIEPILRQIKEIILSQQALAISYEIIPEDKLIGLRVENVIGFFSFDTKTPPSFYEVLTKEEAEAIAAQTGQPISYLRRVSWKKLREVIVLSTVYSEPIDLVELYRKKPLFMAIVPQQQIVVQ